ncbi:MAG TPA: DEAD/DEAH box helicase, partial [Casimicrobiaceae bacterium]|nr:DEAD/DEAH box helicase [Casimicrobiaceae bacterium]
MAARPTTDPLALFHPAVREWFATSFDSPTRPQALGWPSIARGESTLILAPTGSGKTLTAFLWCLDRLMFAPSLAGAPEPRRGSRKRQTRAGAAPTPGSGCRVLYISPLKALAADVERNLRAPLAGIAQIAERRGEPAAAPTIAIRTGDT